MIPEATLRRIYEHCFRKGYECRTRKIAISFSIARGCIVVGTILAAPIFLALHLAVLPSWLALKLYLKVATMMSARLWPDRNERLEAWANTLEAMREENARAGK